MAVYGYARVSTDKQDADRQVRDILAYSKTLGDSSPRIATETMSGVKDRPILEATIAKLRKGDILLVTEFSRLTRQGVPEMLGLARRILAKGAALQEATTGIRYDSSAMGELVMAVTASFDRLEREKIGERTRSALAARKAQGVKLGRPAGGSKLDAHEDEIRKYLAKGISVADIARLLDVARSTLCLWMTRNVVTAKDSRRVAEAVSTGTRKGRK